MNKSELIAAVADTTDLTRAKATEVVEAVFGAIGGALQNKDNVRLAGFGNFTVSTRAEREGRNPQTGAKITIAASTNVSFKAAAALKDSMN